jgi:hypothetical protein
VDETSPGGGAVGGFVKVVFELPRDDDDDAWPPVGSEALWAVVVEPGVVRLDNTPFFVRNVAAGDLIRVSRDADGLWQADERLRWSGHYTIRIIVFPDGPLEGSQRRVLDLFTPLGVTGEGSGQFGMVALDVPPDAHITAVKRLLGDGERDGWWAYDEGCVDDAWRNAEPA